MPYAGDPRGLVESVPSGLFRDSPSALALVDARTGVLAAVNRTFATAMGFLPGELAGRRLEILDRSPDLSEYLLLAAAVGDQEPRHRRWETQDGRMLEVELRATPLGGARRTLLVLRARDRAALQEAEDERRRLETHLHLARKDEAVNGLARGIAHDFNNLLSVILPTVESLRRRLEGDAEAQEDLEAVSDAVVHARELTEALLTFSGRQTMNPRQVSLNDVVVGMEALFRRTLPESIELVLSLCPGQAAVDVDPAQMEQVLLNLVMNARDAMPFGGHLVVRTEEVTLDEEDTAGSPLKPGPHALLEVTDGGEGMDEDTLARMFDPFFTTRKQRVGAGLGLATVQGIVEQSGGRIRVSSAPGRGTTVRVHLPRRAGAPRRRRHAPRIHAGTLPTGTERVLLVEDDARVRHQTGRLLSSLGYSVIQASGPDEALELHAGLWTEDGAHPVDLLMTDVVMPGMSGGRLVRELRVTRQDLPVLYVSGYRDALDVEGEPPPSGSWLAKPFSLRALAEKVREALDG